MNPSAPVINIESQSSAEQLQLGSQSIDRPEHEQEQEQEQEQGYVVRPPEMLRFNVVDPTQTLYYVVNVSLLYCPKCDYHSDKKLRELYARPPAEVLTENDIKMKWLNALSALRQHRKTKGHGSLPPIQAAAVNILIHDHHKEL